MISTPLNHQSISSPSGKGWYIVKSNTKLIAPRKLRGVESQGMILMTETSNGKLAFIEPENDSVNNGKQVS